MPDDPVMVSISSQTGLHPEEIARHTFPSARRGLDKDAVRRYLEALATAMQEALDREQALRRRLAEAERRAAEPELDEETLLRAVGAETARILQTAHGAAGDVVSKAEARAAEVLAEAEGVLAERSAAAHEEAAAILEAAEQEAATLGEAARAEAAATEDAAQAEAEAVTESARAEAIQLLDLTRSECRRIVREARGLRSSVLGDLAERRRGLRVQLEQLRAGRDTLVEVVDAVGEAVEELRARLANAEHDARVAAAEAGEQVEAEEDAAPDLAAIEVELAVDLGEEPETASEEAVALLVDEGLAGELSGQELYDDEAESTEGAAVEQDEHAAQASRRSVDELFARIRAGRVAAEAVDVDAPEIETSDEEELAEPEAPGTGEPAPAAAKAGASDEGAGEVEEPAPAAEAIEAGDERQDDVAVLAARDELLGPSSVKLARSLKRALQDDQNLLLDAIRHASGSPDLDTLLPADEQRGRLSGATARPLADAWVAGYGWLGGESPGQAAAEIAGQQLASELAAEVSGLIRHRLGDALAGVEEIGDGVADAAGAAYREWRGSRVEGVAGDFSARAFSAGAVTGGEGTIVRWVVNDEGGPCPDCDDNALAGDTEAGKEFPTGQLHPPIHPGCRCLIVLASS